MKKIIYSYMVAVLFTVLSSCNENFRFLISPIPQPHIIVRPVAPGPGNIWIEGEWFWNGRNYTWRQGYWTIPNNGYRWNPGLWKKRNAGWYWHPGHWKK